MISLARQLGNERHVGLHEKNIRQEIRVAFLSPSLTEAILTGSQLPSITPDALRNCSAFAWDETLAAR